MNQTDSKIRFKSLQFLSTGFFHRIFLRLSCSSSFSFFGRFSNNIVLWIFLSYFIDFSFFVCWFDPFLFFCPGIVVSSQSYWWEGSNMTTSCSCFPRPPRPPRWFRICISRRVFQIHSRPFLHECRTIVFRRKTWMLPLVGRWPSLERLFLFSIFRLGNWVLLCTSSEDNKWHYASLAHGLSTLFNHCSVSLIIVFRPKKDKQEVSHIHRHW